jgi:hypothetical protein
MRSRIRANKVPAGGLPPASTEGLGVAVLDASTGSIGPSGASHGVGLGQSPQPQFRQWGTLGHRALRAKETLGALVPRSRWRLPADRRDAHRIAQHRDRRPSSIIG